MEDCKVNNPKWWRPFTTAELTAECRRLASLGWHDDDIASTLHIDLEAVRTALQNSAPKRPGKHTKEAA
jgi:hypothetical protein